MKIECKYENVSITIDTSITLEEWLEKYQYTADGGVRWSYPLSKLDDLLYDVYLEERTCTHYAMIDDLNGGSLYELD